MLGGWGWACSGLCSFRPVWLLAVAPSRFKTEGTLLFPTSHINKWRFTEENRGTLVYQGAPTERDLDALAESFRLALVPRRRRWRERLRQVRSRSRSACVRPHCKGPRKNDCSLRQVLPQLGVDVVLVGLRVRGAAGPPASSRESGNGEVLLRGVGTPRYLLPPNASVRQQPDGSTIHAKSGSQEPDS